MAQAATEELGEVQAYLAQTLPPAWCAAYEVMSGRVGQTLQFTVDGFEYLFDLTTDVRDEDEIHEDRVIAVFGTSRVPERGRDSGRMRGFLGGGLTGPNSGDKGHFIAHASGGGLDVNLFPQRPEINRGYSARGKVWRAMERFCADHPGTFCFTRPLYSDRTWRPSELEMGVLKNPRDLWIERFEN